MHKLRESIDEQQKASLEMTKEEKLIVLDFIIHKIKMCKEAGEPAFICNIIEKQFNFLNTFKISFPELYNALQERLKFLRNKDSYYYKFDNPALWRGNQYGQRIIFLTKLKKKLLENNHE